LAPQFSLPLCDELRRDVPLALQLPLLPRVHFPLALTLLLRFPLPALLLFYRDAAGEQESEECRRPLKPRPGGSLLLNRRRHQRQPASAGGETWARRYTGRLHDRSAAAADGALDSQLFDILHHQVGAAIGAERSQRGQRGRIFLQKFFEILSVCLLLPASRRDGRVRQPRRDPFRKNSFNSTLQLRVWSQAR